MSERWTLFFLPHSVGTVRQGSPSSVEQSGTALPRRPSSFAQYSRELPRPSGQAASEGTRLAWLEHQGPGMTEKFLEGPGMARDGLKPT